jgi:PII-like signaling protein
MNKQAVTMARVYLTEGDHVLQALLRCLHDELRVRGVTVMRGIAGFGASGRIHSASLLDISLDLPLVVEFFDTPEKAAAALDKIQDYVGPGHMVTWEAELNAGDE